VTGPASNPEFPIAFDMEATSGIGTIADVLGIASFVILALGVLWLFLRPFPKLMNGGLGIFLLDNRNGTTVSSFAWRISILRNVSDAAIPGYKGVAVPMRDLAYGDAVHIRVTDRPSATRTPDGRPQQIVQLEDPYTSGGWTWTIHLQEGEHVLVEFSWQNPVFPLFRIRRTLLVGSDLTSYEIKTAWFLPHKRMF